MTTTLTSPTAKSAAKNVKSTNATQVSHAMLIQQYCNTILLQPNIALGTETGMQALQTQINNAIATAQNHANYYLNTVQPAIIANMTNIQSYYQMHQAIATTLPVGSTKAEWLTALGVLLTQATGYKGDAKTTTHDIKTFLNDLTGDATALTGFTTTLNTDVSGDDGLLQQLQASVQSVEDSIHKMIALDTLSCIGVVAGYFMAAVGAVADFVTAGTSTSLVVGGIAMASTGVAGIVKTSEGIASLLNQKAGILNEETQLKASVRLMAGISASLTTWTQKMTAAVQATEDMENAWETIEDVLNNLSNDLSSGISSPGEARTIFLTAANAEIQDVLTDINTINQQLAGLTQVPVSSGTTAASALVKAAKNKASSVAHA